MRINLEIATNRYQSFEVSQNVQTYEDLTRFIWRKHQQWASQHGRGSLAEREGFSERNIVVIDPFRQAVIGSDNFEQYRRANQEFTAVFLRNPRN